MRHQALAGEVARWARAPLYPPKNTFFECTSILGRGTKDEKNNPEAKERLFSNKCQSPNNIWRLPVEKKNGGQTDRRQKQARVQARGGGVRCCAVHGAKPLAVVLCLAEGVPTSTKKASLTFCAPADDRRTPLKYAEKLRSERLRRATLALLAARGGLAAVSLRSSGLPRHASLAVEQRRSMSGLALGGFFVPRL